MAGDSETSVCSGALILLGADPIAEIDESIPCNQFYSSTRDSALQAYPWNFAVQRAELAEDATPPAYGFGHRFDLPNDPKCLRILRMEDPRMVFRREGDYLLTDEGTARIKFIAQITSVAEFSPMFREAFEHLLAWKLCYAITGSTSLRKDLMASYKGILEDAEDIDTQEGVNDPDEEYGEFNDLLDAREGRSIGRSKF